MKTLRLILGDQLNLKHSWLKKTDEHTTYCLFEMREETDYVKHHIQKVIGFFAAMRQFSEDLKSKNHQVEYFKINDKNNTQRLIDNLSVLIKQHDFEKFEYIFPDEHRLDKQLSDFSKNLNIPSEVVSAEHFYTKREDLRNFFEGKKQYLMESFYRDMRKKHDILMVADQPEGGKWNYDKENRKPPKAGLTAPEPIRFEPDEITQNVINMVAEKFPNRFGKADDFFFAVTREDAQKGLSYFIKHALPQFGDYQDAMVTGEAFLFHSLLSPYLNTGLLQPLEICEAVETAYKSGAVPLNAAEGYIRQIIGWREYVRGIYWHKMPGYEMENFLGAERKLPEFYWTGETDMHCLSQTIGQTIEHAYAHHIQRLMVTGTFALLTGIDPFEVHEWYLAVYFDAFEWVELPNTLGMSQFGDGGLLASKPYAASGAYINRMSDYCKSCKYNVKNRTEEDACPFNSLYWDFIARNEDTLKGNPRMGMPYRNWEKMDGEVKKALRKRAGWVLENLERL